MSYPDTFNVPSSSVVYEKIQPGQPGHNAKKTFYRAKPPSDGKKFKDTAAAERLWQAHTDKNTSTVYFFSQDTKQTVWVLPDLEVEGGSAPAPAPPPAAPKPTITTTTTATPTPSASPVTAASPSSAEAIRQSIEARLREKMSAYKSGGASSASSVASPTTPAASPLDAVAAGRGTAGVASKPPLTPAGVTNNPGSAAIDTSMHSSSGSAIAAASPTAAGGASSSGGGARLSWREKLEQRRGRSPGAANTPASTPSLDPAAAGPSGTNAPPAMSPLNASTSSQQQAQQQERPSTPVNVTTTPSEQARYETRKQTIGSPPGSAATAAEQQQQPQQEQQQTAATTTTSQQQQRQQQQETAQAAAPAGSSSASAIESEAEQARIRAAQLELEVQQRRLYAAEAEAAAQRELEKVQESRRAAEARRLELELERVKLLSDKKVAHDKMLESFQRGDPTEVRAAAQQRLDDAREQAHSKFQTPTPQRGRGHASPNNNADADSNPVGPVDTAEVDEEVKQKSTVDYGHNFVFKGDVKKGTNIRHGKGSFQYGKSQSGRQTTYDGNWRDNAKEGWGTMNLPSSMYEGDWLHDKLHGRGTLRTRVMQATAPFAKGVAHGNNAAVQIRHQGVYHGPLASNKAGGTGTLHLTASASASSSSSSSPSARNRSSATKNSATSPGAQQRAAGTGPLDIEWKWTDPAVPGTGEACATFADGNVYVGAIKNFTLSGHGRLVFAESGDEYLGEFSHNVMHGKGLYRFAVDGSVYDGEMVDGSFQGLGTFATPTFLYEGEWQRGMMHGMGRIKYSNGDVWEGTFEQHRRSNGAYTFSSVFALEEAVAAQSGK